MKSFSEIIKEVHLRDMQAGDSLSGAFAAANPDAFDPAYDVGPVGPGDAMSEFTGYSNPALNTWVNLSLWKEASIDAIRPITADLFSNTSPIVHLYTDWIAGGTQSAEWPITVTAQLGTNQSVLFSSITDSHSFLIIPTAFPDGTASLSPTTKTVINFSGVTAINESTSANITPTSFKYLHIYGKDTLNHKWEWSNVIFPVPIISWVDGGRTVDYNRVLNDPIPITMTLEQSLPYPRMKVIIDMFDTADNSLFIADLGTALISYNQKTVQIILDKDKLLFNTARWVERETGHYKVVPRLVYTTVEGDKELNIPFKHSDSSITELPLTLMVIFDLLKWQWAYDIYPPNAIDPDAPTGGGTTGDGITGGGTSDPITDDGFLPGL